MTDYQYPLKYYVKKMHNIFSIANYVISHYSHYPGGITPLKLQKLMYYLKVWGIVADVPILADSFKKWKYGPVNDELYTKYKTYGAQPIPTTGTETVITQDKNFIDFVLESYAPFSALTLSSLTHQEEPWQKTGDNEIISDSLIKAYYQKQHFAKNFPLKASGPYFPVLTDMYYSFVLDMDQTKLKQPVYSSFEDYKSWTAKAKADIEKALHTYLNPDLAT